MSCPDKAADYPDYLKSILEQIDTGSNNELRPCACSLNALTDDEGCVLLDEDGKLGLFPGCIEVIEEAELENMGYGTYYPFGISQKQLMELCWKYKKIKINGEYLELDFCPNPSTVQCDSVGSWVRCDRRGLVDPKPTINADSEPKERVCRIKQTYSLGKLITTKPRVGNITDYITIELFGGTTKRLKNTNIFFPHINIIVDITGINDSANPNVEVCVNNELNEIIRRIHGVRRTCKSPIHITPPAPYGIEGGNQLCETCCDYGINHLGFILQYQTSYGTAPSSCCGCSNGYSESLGWYSEKMRCVNQVTQSTWSRKGGINIKTKKGKQPPRPDSNSPSVATFSFLNDPDLLVYLPYYIGEYKFLHA